MYFVHTTFWNLGNFCLWNLESWTLESWIQFKESEIPLTIGIWNPMTKNPGLQFWNPESTVYNRESIFGFPYMIRFAFPIQINWLKKSILKIVQDIGYFCILYAAIESFRFEDENECEYEIWLKVFYGCSLNKTPGKALYFPSPFFTEKVSTVTVFIRLTALGAY